MIKKLYNLKIHIKIVHCSMTSQRARKFKEVMGSEPSEGWMS